MRIVQINATCGAGSTGKICVAVSRLLSERGIENHILYTSGKSDYPLGIRYASDRYIKLQALLSRITGRYGFVSRRATSRLLRHLDRLSPDVIHLHNLHGHNVDLGRLLAYIRQRGIKVYWTFHDCWAFTGYCPYFDMAACDRWESGCRDCPQRRGFSWFFDRSATLQAQKRELLKDLDLTVITPSEWLAGLVRRSFLGAYPIRVINNGIDLSVFRPRESELKRRLGIEGKHLLLGVAFDWSPRKGLDVFVELARRLDDRFRILLVGVDGRTAAALPDSILTVGRTKSQAELAEIYSAADLFVNPTREENYPTVNMESLASGTPVLTFRTGGSPEMLDEATGFVVEKDDIDGLERVILSLEYTAPGMREACLRKAAAFDQGERFREYLALYDEASAEQ